MNAKRYDGLNLEQYQSQNSMKNEEEPFANPDLIPGVKEGGWSWDDFKELKKQKERSFNLMCQNIIESMRKHKSSWPFIEPVNRDDVADYFEVIADPIDIKTIEKKLQSNYYVDKETFISDVKRIFVNCRKYNQPGTIYYKAANDLEEYVEPQLESLKESQIGNHEQGSKPSRNKK